MTKLRTHSLEARPAVRVLVAAAVLLCAPMLHAAGSRRLIPFQARLMDQTTPINATPRVTFTIYDAPVGGTQLWSETHAALPATDGMVNVLLGSVRDLDDPNGDGDTADAIRFDSALGPRYLGIKVGPDLAQEMVPRQSLVPSFHARTADAVVPDGVTTEAIQDRAITAQKIDPGAGVPVGAVIMWWGRLADIPYGFELCDGGLPNTDGALLQGNKPDLVDRFPRGAWADWYNPPEVAIGGGSDRLPNGRTNDAYLLPNQLPSHTHGFSAETNAAGSHTHGWQAAPGSPAPCAGDDPGATDLAFALGDGNKACPNIMSSAGSHQHSVAGQTDGGTQTSGGIEGDGHYHGVSLGDYAPPHLYLFFIIRVK